MVTAPANTGIDSVNSNAVTIIYQVYKGKVDHYWYGSMPHLIPMTVPMKLTALDRDETPARCMANIIKSTADPG